jgi:hypothetical protein
VFNRGAGVQRLQLRPVEIDHEPLQPGIVVGGFPMPGRTHEARRRSEGIERPVQAVFDLDRFNRRGSVSGTQNAPMLSSNSERVGISMSRTEPRPHFPTGSTHALGRV